VVRPERLPELDERLESLGARAMPARPSFEDLFLARLAERSSP